LEQVISAAKSQGKASGILSRPEFVAQHKQLGFQFMALGSDSGSVVSGLASTLKQMQA
jgi:2-keto-3-deoxy-L-rhamnonate aldolase RhmA